MRHPLTATFAVCCLLLCVSCGSNVPGRDDVPTASVGRLSPSAHGVRRAVPAAASGGEAEEAPRFVPGRLVVKFRDTLGEPADLIQRHGLKFAASARSGGAELDRLHAQYRVSSITPMFSSLFARAIAAPGKGALADRRRKLKETVSAARARFAARAARAGPRAGIPDLVHVYVLEVPADTDLRKMARDFAANPNVESAVPDQLARTQALPDDPYLASSGAWGQAYGDLWALATIGAPTAWDVATGRGTVVAVVDSGLDYNHPDIAGNVWINEAELNGLPGVDDDGNGYVDDVRGWDFAYGDADPMDAFGHGTHVSGTVAAAGNNGVGVIGVAYQARIMPVKGLNDSGSGAMSSLASAITYAARNGADVINNSWGCSGCSADAALVDAVKLARSLGCVVAFAAGNSAADVKDFFPANLQDVITVASSGADGSRSSFSNWGYLVDVSAPGGGPDGGSLYAGYRNILSLRAANTGDPNLIVGGSYLRQAGTSMATPHVSGVAALVLSANPQLTVAQVESILRHTARDGVGDPSLDTGGWDPYFGWGRLDAAAAVASAFDPPADPPVLEVVGGQLEFDVPATMCAGQQWSFPVALYNVGGDVLEWTASGPDWLAVEPSGTTPSFPLVSLKRVADGTGTLTIGSNAANGPAELSVAQRVSSDVTIANCSTVLSQANGDQRWDPLQNWRPPGVPDGSGGAYYVWVDTRKGNPDLFMQRVDGGGNPLWTPDGVPLTSATGSETRVTIISDGSGGAIVAWAEGSNTGGTADKHIRAQRVNQAGEKLWGVDGVWACRATGGQLEPTAVYDRAGGAIIAWQDYRAGASDIYAQRIDASGSVRWQVDGVPVTRATDAQFDAAMASDGKGGAIVTWVDRRSAFWAVYAQRVDSAGQTLWTQDGVLIAPQIASGPNIVPDGTGGAIIAWHDFRNVPLNPGGATALDRSDIYAMRVNSLGQNLWMNGAVPVVSGLTVAPNTFLPGWGPDQVTMTPDGRGGAFVVWHDARNGSWDVYTQRVGSRGSMLWGTTGVPVTAAPADQFAPAVVADGEDGAVYAWSDTRPGHADVFVQRLGPTGEPLAAPNGVWLEGKPGDQLYPFVVPLAAGRFLVTWDDESNCSSGYCEGTWADLLGKVVQLPRAPSFPLTVVRGGDGAGNVTSSPARIICGEWCSADFPAGSSVTLTAYPSPGSAFSGWTGACTGASSTCTVAMDDARTVTPTFSLMSYGLTVTTSGSGRGTVTGDGISCTTGSTAGCTASVPNTTPATSVTLTATPDATSAFAGWTGCATVSGNVCTVSMDAVKTVTAAFQAVALLTVKTSGAGAGTVTGEGIACTTGSTDGCTAQVPLTSPATSVTLTATPDAASLFSGWSGCTSVSGNVCTVSMTAAKTATAMFQPSTWLLTAKTSGSGIGTVTGAGISCASGSTAGCTASVPNTSPATTVTLTAAPDAGSIFSSWSGCTSASGNLCTVSMTAARSVTATFQPATYPLTLNSTGGGGGTAFADPGFTCTVISGVPCTGTFANGATVVLTASADTSSVFKSWTGCTSVSGATCTITMTGAKTVTLRLEPSAYPLAVSVSGGGSVEGGGIACTTGSTGDCTEAVANGASVTLTATPDAVSIFKSWSTGCTPASGNVCTVSMTAAKSVTATFQPATYPLTTVVSGNGSVTGPGIACTTGSTGDCTEAVANGASVTLTATPDAGSIFKSWSTGCTSVSGTSCTVSMTIAKSVTATFQPATYPLTTVVSGNGSVTGPGIACTTGSTGDCTEAVANGASVTLTATPDATSLFKSWVGCSSVSGTSCTVSMTAAKSVTATFQPTTYPLTAVVSGNGSVTGPGIACTTGSTGDCTEAVANGASVTLTATPEATSLFKSWVGCTSVSGTSCTVSMTAAKSVTATFQPSTYPLTTVVSGNGTVTGPGIACATGSTGDCTEAMANGASVTLVAAPGDDAIFKSWSGCTSVSGTSCTVSMTAAKSVTATFQPSTYQLTTVVSGTGTVSGPGIACATGSTGDCTEAVANGASVTLTATPDDGAIFKSWSTGCASVSGTSCTVSMTMAKSVTATFQPATWLLTVRTSGTGLGTVTGEAISCTTGSTAGCTAAVPNTSPATSVTLTAAPEPGSTFSSWSGCNSVSGATCTVSVSAARTVTAAFGTAPAM